MPIKAGPAIERLRKRISVTPSGCWHWTGTKYQRGYGAMWYKGALRRAHRVSFELHNGVIADGMVIHHKCENRSCEPGAPGSYATR